MAHEQGPSVCVGRGGERYIWGGFLLFRGVWYTMLGGGGGENDHGLFLEGICVKRLCCVLLFFVLQCSCALGQGDAAPLELRQQIISLQEELASSVSGNLRDVSYRICEILGENGLMALPLPGEATGEAQFLSGDSYVFSDDTYGSRGISLDASDGYNLYMVPGFPAEHVAAYVTAMSLAIRDVEGAPSEDTFDIAFGKMVTFLNLDDLTPERFYMYEEDGYQYTFLYSEEIGIYYFSVL